VSTTRADAVAQRRAARGFGVGSACFAAASFVSQWASVPRSGIGVTFFAGSLFFTTAAARQLAHASGGGDRVAALVQLAGTLLFNVSTFLAMERHLSARQSDLRVWAPDVFGSACFLVASAMAFAAVRHGAHSRAWWIATLNLAGSLAFAVSAVTSLVEPRDDQPVSAAITNATTTLGALCFLAGAVLLGRDRSVSSVSDDGRRRRPA
jgi:cytochrome bd-type quinol oxidase subunit 2